VISVGFGPLSGPQPTEIGKVGTVETVGVVLYRSV